MPFRPPATPKSLQFLYAEQSRTLDGLDCFVQDRQGPGRAW